LPGVVLHEVVYWLAAGLLNVRAERAIAWPEKQEIGELHLNFVQLSKRAGQVRTAIISTAPLFVGIAVVWLIADSIFDIPAIVAEMNSSTQTDMGTAINRITSTPDAWLWLYLMFTISNTMIPRDTKTLRGWWLIAGVFAVIAVIAFVLGIGEQIFTNTLAVPINDILTTLSGIFAIIIVLNLLATVVLAIIENTIEWITGDSATFKNGKMIVMRRDEMRALREQERRRTRQRRERQAATAGGPPSIYKLALPIPGVPGQEPVTQGASSIVTPQESTSLPTRKATGDSEPAVITGSTPPKSGGIAARLGSSPSPSSRPKSPALPGGRSQADKDKPETKKTGTAEVKKPALAPRPAPSGQPGAARFPSQSAAATEKDKDKDDLADSRRTAKPGLPGSASQPAAGSFADRKQPTAPPLRSRLPGAEDKDTSEDKQPNSLSSRLGSSSPRPFPSSGGSGSRGFPVRKPPADDDEDDTITDDGITYEDVEDPA
jgi:hypothetical protein